MTKHRDSSQDENLSGSYALDALTDDERALFEAQLRESEELRAEVASFADTAAMLASIAPPVTPPARLKADLFARLDSSPQLRPQRETADETDAVPPTRTESGIQQAPAQLRAVAATATSKPVETPAADAPTARVVDLVARRRNRVGRRVLITVASMAAAVALFAGGIAYGTARTSDDAATAQLAAISTASDVQLLNMELPTGGAASLLVSAEVGQSALVMHDMPALPNDEVYQAWFVRGNGPISAGVVDASGDGYRVLEGEYHSGDAVAITVEPAGGSEKPTTDPFYFTAAPSTASV